MVVAITAGREARPAVGARIGLLLCVLPHVDLQVPALQEPHIAELTLEEGGLVEMRVPMVKAQAGGSRVGLIAAIIFAVETLPLFEVVESLIIVID